MVKTPSERPPAIFAAEKNPKPIANTLKRKSSPLDQPEPLKRKATSAVKPALKIKESFASSIKRTVKEITERLKDQNELLGILAKETFISAG